MKNVVQMHDIQYRSIHLHSSPVPVNLPVALLQKMFMKPLTFYFLILFKLKNYMASTYWHTHAGLMRLSTLQYEMAVASVCNIQLIPQEMGAKKLVLWEALTVL